MAAKQTKSYKVLKEFRDKNTKERYGSSRLYVTDDTKRAEELQKGGWLGNEVVEKKPDPPKETEPPKEPEDKGKADANGKAE